MVRSVRTEKSAGKKKTNQNQNHNQNQNMEQWKQWKEDFYSAVK